MGVRPQQLVPLHHSVADSGCMISSTSVGSTARSLTVNLKQIELERWIFLKISDETDDNTSAVLSGHRQVVRYWLDRIILDPAASASCNYAACKGRIS